jgi:tetratricopeptide (TPR) repeat protein
MPRPLILSILVLVPLASVALGARGIVEPQDERRAKEYFITGTSLQQIDRHAEAILEFQESLRHDSSAVTLASIARSFMALKKFDRARYHAELAARMDSTIPMVWETLAEVLVSTGAYDEAVDAYERLRTLAPSARQLYTLGRLYEPRDARKAIEIFEMLVKDRPDPEIIMLLSDLYARVKDTVGQIRTMERALQTSPGESEFAADLVRLYVQAGRVADAASMLHGWAGAAYATFDKERVWAAGLLALLQDSSVTASHAADVLQLVRSIDAPLRRSWRIQAMAGALALRMQERQLADARFHDAIDVAGSDPDVPVQVALAYFNAELHKPGFDVLARSAPGFPADPRFPYFMGIACVQMQQDSAGIVLFKRTLQIDATFSDAWVQLAMIYDNLGRSDSAETAYAEALRLDPENHLVNNNFAYALAVRGQELDRARSMAWRALQQNPSNPAYLDTYAWILHRLGDNDQARSFIERAIERGGNATHHEHHGDILEGLGLIDQAIKAWERSLELDPSRESVRSKLTRYR